MKRMAMTLAVILLSSSLFADNLVGSNFPFEDDKQPQNSDSDTQTLFGSHDFTFSGFGGMYSSTTVINGNYTTFMGGRATAILNDTFIIGGGGMGLVHPLSRSDYGSSQNSQESRYISMGYGGMIFGLNFFQKSILNLSLTTLIGNGDFCLTENVDQEGDCENGSVDEYFVAEPMAMLNINITKWMRIGCGVSYKYFRGLRTEEFSDSDFSGFSYVAAVDFGWF